MPGSTESETVIVDLDGDIRIPSRFFTTNKTESESGLTKLSGSDRIRIRNSMVFILDGCSFHYEHTWRKQASRFVEGIWLYRKSRQIQFFSEKDLVFIIRAQHE